MENSTTQESLIKNFNWYRGLLAVSQDKIIKYACTRNSDTRVCTDFEGEMAEVDRYVVEHYDELDAIVSREIGGLSKRFESAMQKGLFLHLSSDSGKVNPLFLEGMKDQIMMQYYTRTYLTLAQISNFYPDSEYNLGREPYSSYNDVQKHRYWQLDEQLSDTTMVLDYKESEESTQSATLYKSERIHRFDESRYLIRGMRRGKKDINEVPRIVSEEELITHVRELLDAGKLKKEAIAFYGKAFSAAGIRVIPNGVSQEQIDAITPDEVISFVKKGFGESKRFAMDIFDEKRQKVIEARTQEVATDGAEKSREDLIENITLLSSAKRGLTSILGRITNKIGILKEQHPELEDDSKNDRK